MSHNTIKRIAFPQLLDGRTLVIPSYQRGYRWTPTQVTQLLHDLFSYAYEPHTQGDYYCLQPIVAHRGTKPDTWVIIDGQQRLTTLYILYRYLMQQKGIDDQRLEKVKGGKKVYRIEYSTRKSSADFLQQLGQPTQAAADNIDFFHMSQAYDTIDQWMQDTESGGLALCKRYNVEEELDTVWDTFFDLLNANQGKISRYGSLQLLWYELPSESGAIDEFRKTNTGKIYLTDAELIKALFLREQTVSSPNTLMQRSLAWEDMENKLHNDAFWFFLNKRGTDIPNRIDFLFRLAYIAEHIPQETTDKEWRQRFGECQKSLKVKNSIFNFYYDKFDGHSGTDLHQCATREWEAVERVFHILEDWYEDVVCYNLIGMLCQYGDDLLPKCYLHFIQMDENKSRDDFKSWLKEQIKLQLKDVSVDNVSYGDPRVFNLLLLLNVSHLTRQAQGSASRPGQVDSIYKFPFSVLTREEWNIEHIDSFTRNGLKKTETKKQWVETAHQDLAPKMSPEQEKEYNTLLDSQKYDNLIELLRTVAKETEAPDEEKNSIGNLTLLDSSTNKSYGNSLFVTKRRIIIEKMKNGVFVPQTTAYVFMKLFDSDGTRRSEWTIDDMHSYQEYINQELKEYLQ